MIPPSRAGLEKRKSFIGHLCPSLPGEVLKGGGKVKRKMKADCSYLHALTIGAVIAPETIS